MNYKQQRPTAKSPQEIFYQGRAVRWNGRIFRVQWCDGEYVQISAGQGPYQNYYEVQPGSYEWNNYRVPVNHIFLQPL